MKQLVHILMVIILSLSIVAPSVLSIYSDHYDIEIRSRGFFFWNIYNSTTRNDRMC